jgi:hypothetical protein
MKSECPLVARAPVDTTADDAAAIKVAIATAINKHVYGTAAGAGADASIDALAMALPIAGTAALTRAASSVTWTYSVTESSNAAALAVVDTCEVNTGDTCKKDLAVACLHGAYGIITAGNRKICALCPAGTYSADGITCTACDAGKASGSVGADASADCGICGAGHYAEPGSSDCLLCPAGTFHAGDASGACTPW